MFEKESIILSVAVSTEKPRDIINWCQSVLEGQTTNVMFTPNPEIILLARKNKTFRKTLMAADKRIADGFGLQIASVILGNTIPPRLTGVDVMETLCSMAATQKIRIGLLGGVNAVEQRVKTKLEYMYPGIEIVYANHGMLPQSFTFDSPELIKEINQAGVELLFVAFGAPKQEQWLIHNKEQLNCKLAIGVGGAFDYIAGDIKRAPNWLRKIGLEWLYRLLKQPARIKRIINAVIVFPVQVFFWRWRMLTKYRPNASAMIINQEKKILLCRAKRYDEENWQMPQGGIDPGEKAQHAVLREIEEEVGLTEVAIYHYEAKFHSYKAPHWAQSLQGYKGQVQDLFIILHNGNDNDVKLDNEEFDDYAWVSPDEVMVTVEPNRRESMQKALIIAKKQGIL